MAGHVENLDSHHQCPHSRPTVGEMQWRFLALFFHFSIDLIDRFDRFIIRISTQISRSSSSSAEAGSTSQAQPRWMLPALYSRVELVMEMSCR
mmetsp:Transcript_24169/g.52597  ORF Transcript_24169/g.52597 Transcript_24169/m.52597 type:complete len:93 (+) Transcript_24169:2125-2403(+)